MTAAAAVAPRPAAAALTRVFLLALVVRAALFPFAENKHGDAPMRALIAERLDLDPAAASDPRAYCQFGPLHTTLMRPFLAVDPRIGRSSRVLSLLAGLLVFWPFSRLAARLVGPDAAWLAVLGLAVSPLHVQASTTAASEALYLLLFVAMLERLVAALDAASDAANAGARASFGAYAAAGAFASLAAVTRYDAWLAIPAAALAAWFARPPFVPRARWLAGLGVFAAVAAVLPLGWVLWGAAVTDDPFFFGSYIKSDHAQLAAVVVARFGPTLARLRQLGIWSLAFAAAMTPPLALAAALAWRFRARLAVKWPLMRVVLVAALAPVVVYLGQGLLRLRFEPMPRFAIVPGALLLPLAAAVFAPARLAAARLAVLVTAPALAVGMFALSQAGGARAWGGAESMGALTRLDAEDRALAAALRARRAPHERVMIEPLAFAEIAIYEEAGVPQTESVTLAITREPRATAAETMRATGARWIAAYDHAGGWARSLPDWPRDALAFGGWRLIHASALEGSPP